MRFSTATLLFASAAALSACGGSTSDTLDLGNGTSICGLDCPTAQIPVNDRGDATGNTGNTASVSASTGDATIVLEHSVITNLGTDTPAYSSLAENIAGKTVKISIDTNTPNQSTWPKPKDMKLYGTSKPGLGGTYREYRALTRSNGAGTSAATLVDEELQVWRWGHSYGTQYRHISSGGEATHQAWSFGGTKTAAAKVPTSGSASFSGQYGATAKTWNFIDETNDRLATLSANGLWRVTGKSDSQVNFGNGAVKTTLTPKVWTGWQTRNGEIGFVDVNVDAPANPQNLFSFMKDRVVLKGKLTTAGTGNKIEGEAAMLQSDGWVSGGAGNPFYGALFGPNGEEIAGVFNTEGTIPDPLGPSPINDDRRGFINQSGVFNGKK